MTYQLTYDEAMATDAQLRELLRLLYERRANTNGHGRRARLQRRIDALEAERAKRS